MSKEHAPTQDPMDDAPGFTRKSEKRPSLFWLLVPIAAVIIIWTVAAWLWKAIPSTGLIEGSTERGLIIVAIAIVYASHNIRKAR